MMPKRQGYNMGHERTLEIEQAAIISNQALPAKLVADRYRCI